MSPDTSIVGIDIGTTKIVTLIGKKNEFGLIDVIGMGVNPSYGLRKGIVIDIDKTTESIKRSVAQAEEIAGAKVTSAFVGIAGGHISSKNHRAVRFINSDDRIVTETDKDLVLGSAQVVDLPDDQEVLHVISRGFSIDGESGVVNPVGMACRRLEAEVHIVTGSIASIKNVTTCVERCGVGVKDIVLEPIASSKAVLTEPEKEFSSLLVDIGGGTSDMAFFVNGAIAHTFVLPVGGNHVTQDVAYGLKVTIDEAERIKCAYGSAQIKAVDEADILEIRALMREPRPILRRKLAMIIEPRMHELFKLIAGELKRTGLSPALAGIVLTGGGARLDDIDELAASLFNVPVRIGFPLGVDQNAEQVRDPMYATAVGLLRYAIDDRIQPRADGLSKNWLGQFSGLTTYVDRVRSWFAEYF